MTGSFTEMSKIMTCRNAQIALSASLALAIAGCGSTPPPQVGPAAYAPVVADGQGAYASALGENYPISVSDVISVTVFREPDMSVDRVPVDANGMISLPFVGRIQAKGLTAGQLSSAITAKLGKGYLVSPQVTVNVMEYASHQVTVEGAVTKPGIYQFKPGARLSGAISLAEGISRTAKARQVAVFRPDADGHMMIAKFDYAAIQQGTMLDPVMMPGDRVVVGTSGLSQAWQDFLKTVPLFALFFRF